MIQQKIDMESAVQFTTGKHKITSNSIIINEITSQSQSQLQLYFSLFIVLTHHVSKAYKNYGPLVRIWLFFFPFFAILDPNDLQTVLSSSKHTDKIFFYKLLHNFLGTGLITSSGK